MQFASMASLWFALSLPLIIAMYLLKKKYQDTEVSSNLLWQRVLQPLDANRPWQKLRRNLLLVLQLIVAALLVVALMEPIWWSEGKRADHLVIVFDRSASLQQKTVSPSGEESTIFETLKKQAVEQLQQYEINLLTILAIGDVPEIVLAKSAEKAEWEASIQSLKPHYGRAAYQETMSLAAALHQEEESDTHTIVFTDGRWTEPVSMVEWAAPPQFVQPDHSLLREDNASVRQFGVALHEQTNTVSASVVLRNGGDAVKEAQLLLYADGKLHEASDIALAGDADETLFFRGLPRAELYHVQMEIDDAIEVDNEAYAFLSASQNVVAWMTGNHFFLEKALQLSNVHILKSDQLSDTSSVPLSDVDIVIRAFQEGDDNEEWLEDRPAWVFGSPTGERTQLRSTRYHVLDHPVTQHVSLRDSYISHIYPDQPFWSGLHPIVQAGGESLISAGQVNGHPKLQFHFQLEDSDLPLRSDFPLLIKQAVDWLTQGKRNQLGHFFPAGIVEAGLSSETKELFWKDDLGNKMNVERAATEYDVFIAPSEPGLYELVEEDGQGQVLHTRYLSVTMDPRESHAGYDQFETFVQELGEQHSQSPSEDHSTQFPSSLLPWLAFFILLIIVVEWGVYQRGISV